MTGIEDIKNSQIARGFTITNINSIQIKFDLPFPISTVEDYNKLNEKLKDSDLQNDLVCERNYEN